MLASLNLGLVRWCPCGPTQCLGTRRRGGVAHRKGGHGAGERGIETTERETVPAFLANACVKQCGATGEGLQGAGSYLVIAIGRNKIPVSLGQL